MGEISLRELIEIILKRKWVIICITLICIILSGTLSFFVMKPVYESKSTFMVNPIDIKSGINPNTTIIFSGDPKSLDSTRKLENKMLGSILSQVRYPQIDANKMVAFMNSTEYITKVLKDLGISTKEYDYIKNIKMQFDEKTSLISASGKYGNADMALKIKKALIDSLPGYVLNKANEQYAITEEILNQGIDRETKNFEEWKKKLADYVAASGGLDKLTPEKQAEYQGLYNNYILANQALDSYQIVKKEFDNVKAMDIKKMMNIQVVADDRLPLEPISPKKALNLAVAAVLGMMVSVFLVFFIEYWEKSKEIVC